MDEIKAETIFEALAQMTAIEYIGKVEGLDSITLRLAKLQQIAYYPKSRASIYLPTQQLHQQFQSVLAEIDGSDINEGSDIPSIAHMFFDALSHRLKTRVEASLPDRIVPDFQTNLNRYHVFRAEVERKRKRSNQLSTSPDPYKKKTGRRNPHLGQRQKYPKNLHGRPVRRRQ
jgi:hypothetical protein